MPRDRERRTRRRVQVLFGIVLACILYSEFNKEYVPDVRYGAPVVLAAERVEADPFERLVRTDPLSALIEARERLIRESRDYVCTFVKQEMVGSRIRAEQELDIKFRPEPFSVVMKWVRNPGLAQRAIYVKGKWIDEDATDPELREQAVCQPVKLLSIFTKSLKQPIHGTMAKRAARRSIDEFGFKRALDLLIQYCETAQSRGELSLEFLGETHFDGRPVWLVRRHLPYTGEGGMYPDRTADVFIDQEHYIPIAVYCYSDESREPENLLGKYEYRNVRFDVGLTEKDFDPATYGM